MVSIYGIVITTGVLISTLFVEHLIKKYQPKFSVFKAEKSNPIISTDDFWNAILWVSFLAFIGARLYHVIDYLEYYALNPQEIIKTWEGGMGIFGGVFGGIFGIFIFSFLKSKSFIKKYKGKKPNGVKTLFSYFYTLADYIVLGAPLAQAIGRWGNYFNNELFGKPTNLPWAITIPFDKRPEGLKLYETFHPLFLYESILNLILFGVLFLFFSRKKAVSFPGLLLFTYLIGYSLIRLILEPLHINPWTAYSIPTASLISISIILTSALIIVFRLKRQKNKTQKRLLSLDNNRKNKRGMPRFFKKKSK